MVFRDEWDRDPSVQMMREIFSQMEKVQGELLRDLKISPFDQRLRDGREHARDLFERLWPVATRQGIAVGERDAALLYAHCLAHALNQRRVPSPGKGLEENGEIVRFFKENL